MPMARLSPNLKTSVVTMLGGLTLASSVGYFLALARALFSDNEAWSAFFSSHILWFLYVPFTLGLVYFYARVQLGRSLLDDGALAEAVAWTTPRQRYNFWMRGKRETLIQRLVLAQAHMRLLDSSGARDALWSKEPLPGKAKELLELHVWRGLWALRHEDLVLATAASEAGVRLKKPAVHRAELLALDAMRTLRARDVDAAQQHLEASRWLAQTWLADLARVLMYSQMPVMDDETRLELLACHEQLAREIATRLPGALPEYLVASARLNYEDAEVAAAWRARARALVEQGDADPRSVWIVQQMINDDCREESHHEEE